MKRDNCDYCSLCSQRALLLDNPEIVIVVVFCVYYRFDYYCHYWFQRGMFIADPDIDYETIYEVDTYAPPLPALASQMIATLILVIVTTFD